MTDQDLNTQQEEVSRLMGRCVMRLQQYEMKLKSIVANHDISGAVTDMNALRATRIAGTSHQTLGSLVNTFLGSVLVNGEPLELRDWVEERPDDPPSLRVTLRFGLAESDFARTGAELRDLVQMRNDLIHHFMERHALWTLDGCRVAQEELAANCDRIGQHIVRLREWAEHLENAQEQVCKEFQSDAFREMVVNGILPDGGVFWPGAGIVVALREASRNLAVNGWTDVTLASRWIAEHYPHQTPAKYGCVTMRHVVHASGAFDLRVFEKDGIRRRNYRLRENAN